MEDQGNVGAGVKEAVGSLPEKAERGFRRAQRTRTELRVATN